MMNRLFGGGPPKAAAKPSTAAAPTGGLTGMGAGSMGGSGAGAAGLIKDSTTATFMQDVVDASFEAPVIVDFWAPWCGPCKTLGPIIEKAVKEARGAVRLVKVDIDQSPEIAQQMRIQSIPAVYAFKDGRPVDGFVGALPESQVKAFVKRLGGAAGPNPIEEALGMAKEALAAGDAAGAANLYGQIVEADPEHVDAIAGLARALVALGEHDEARELIGRIPPAKQSQTEVLAAKAALDLAEAGARAAGNLSGLTERVRRDPDDQEARLELASALFAAGQREQAVEELLDMVRRDRAWNEQAARKQLVKFFEAMGPVDKLTLSGRRRLSSILFS